MVAFGRWSVLSRSGILFTTNCARVFANEGSGRRMKGNDE